LPSGDADFLDLVYEVRNLGKQIRGAFFDKHMFDAVRESFDKEYVLNQSLLDPWIMKPKP